MNGDQPAFARTSHGATDATDGLTKREYFAALILQGFAARGGTALDLSASGRAVQHADALLEALQSGTET